MRFPRSSGLLLHPTALPGPQGCGDLGHAAHAFVDQLAAAGQSLWQVLPLGPTGFGDSPYQSFSAFAGNPSLVSAEQLREAGLLTADDVARVQAPGSDAADFGAAVEGATHIAARLAEALERPEHRQELERFRATAPWLADYTLFMALREAHGQGPWTSWPEPIRRREPAALAEAARALATPIGRHAAMQWAFARQWRELRAHAHSRGVQLFGDVPIFVAFDSAEVWAAPGLFSLNDQGQPLGVAGVPPDYFSATGQLWGNPVYRWEAHAADDFAWWRARLATVGAMVGRVRLDHFIAFVRHWEVPAGAPDARAGRWVQGPGAALFRALERELGSLPLVAEDLGETGPDVEALRDELGLPGMRVLQFAFDGDPSHSFLPHRHVGNCVVYTGTHDNDTTLGWWATLGEYQQRFARDYLGESCGDIAWDLIGAGMRSVADTFVAPVQDVLSLGSEARFNTPGEPRGNWTWRLSEGQFRRPLQERLREVTLETGRMRG